MNEIICYTPYIPEGDVKIISFMDILLNDQWAGGGVKIQCPESVYTEIGDVNKLLPQKQNYEFMLRAAKVYSIKAIGVSSLSSYNHNYISDESLYNWECFQTDCYIAAKYQQELIENGCYSLVMEMLGVQAMQFSHPEEAISWMRKMITRSIEYWKIDDNTCPILIYRADDICQKVLLSFSDQLAANLRMCHQRVEVFDYRQSDPYSLEQYIGRRFKAIIGIQSPYFSFQIDDIYLHNLIIGPKYNMIFDHPVFLRDGIMLSLKDYFILTHDRDYISFIKRFYKEYVTDCFQLAPAGMLPEVSSQVFTKIYDISFIGTYVDYRQGLVGIYRLDLWERHFFARCLHLLKRNPDITVEEALEKVFLYYNLQVDDKIFEEQFCGVRCISTIISNYYREKVIATLLNAGITVHVFGDTWGQSPFAQYSNCIIHSDLTIYESMEVFQKSKISLNIMKWHKDGLTERILNSMLCKSLMLSDKSRYLEENFINGEEIVLFELSKLDCLPSIVNNLLSDSALLDRITSKGYEKAMKQHLWIHRAKQLLHIIENNRTQ